MICDAARNNRINSFARALFTTSDTEGDPNALLPQQAALFVLTDAPLEEVQAHFRRFTRVRDEEGLVMLFRFYGHVDGFMESICVL